MGFQEPSLEAEYLKVSVMDLVSHLSQVAALKSSGGLALSSGSTEGQCPPGPNLPRQRVYAGEWRPLWVVFDLQVALILAYIDVRFS